ncbi:MAG TPA: hypothetical protein VLG71_00825 [Candidatus Limnocylindria bacterium]|nr:hypothetical protein [Candidatus Limnocylindria bacterium]
MITNTQRGLVLAMLLSIGAQMVADVKAIAIEARESLANGYQVAKAKEAFLLNPEYVKFMKLSYAEQMNVLARETLRSFAQQGFNNSGYWIQNNFTRDQLALAVTYKRYLAQRLNALHFGLVNLKNSIEEFDKLMNKGDKRLSLKEAVNQAFGTQSNDERLKPYEKDPMVALRESVNVGEEIVMSLGDHVNIPHGNHWHWTPSKVAMQQVREKLGLNAKPEPVVCIFPTRPSYVAPVVHHEPKPQPKPAIVDVPKDEPKPVVTPEPVKFDDRKEVAADGLTTDGEYEKNK